MAGIIDNRHDYIDELDTDEELVEPEMVDDEDGIDLDGDQDEGTDEEIYDEENDQNDLEEEDGEELDEPDKEESSEEEADSTDTEEEETQVSEKDAKIAELERQKEFGDTKYAKFEKQVKETLEKMGIAVDGKVEDALDRLAAEADGKTLEEYRKEKDEQAEIEDAKRILARQRFEQLAANDLAELKKSFPDLLQVDNIRKCFKNVEDFVQFGKLRDSGISPKNAYMAVNGDQIRTAQAQAAQKKVAGDGKRHITSVTPKKAADTNVVMPKATLLEWRDNFPELSDAEIRKLYKQTL